MSKYFGVNLAGAEFGSNLPGTKGVDYIYPTILAEYQYYSNKKLLLYRIPLRWERIQRIFLGNLFYADIQDIKTCLDNVLQVGGKAFIELHNYGLYDGQAVTLQNQQNFIDVWTKLAQTLGSHPALFGYELMNEPHDLPDGSSGWKTIVQATVNAIRKVDTTNYILAPGYDWQSAQRWPQSNANFTINDPANKLLYSAHAYFDTNASGTYPNNEQPTDTNIGVERISPFISWLKANNASGIITEYGVPFSSPSWFPILDSFLNILNTSDQIVGGTYWAGGPWWGEYILTIEPTNNFVTDRPEMAVLQKYPTTALLYPPTPAPTPTPTPAPPTAPPTMSLDVVTLNQLIKDSAVITKQIRSFFKI